MKLRGRVLFWNVKGIGFYIIPKYKDNVYLPVELISINLLEELECWLYSLCRYERCYGPTDSNERVLAIFLTFYNSAGGGSKWAFSSGYGRLSFLALSDLAWYFTFFSGVQGIGEVGFQIVWECVCVISMKVRLKRAENTKKDGGLLSHYT